MLFIETVHFLIGDADFLSACSHSIGRIADNRIQNRRRAYHWPVEILDPKVRPRQLVVIKIGSHIKLFYLVNTFDLVRCLPTDSISLDDANVQVRAKHECSEVLHGSCDRTGANEWIIDHVTRTHLSLVRHEKCQLVVSGGGPEVWAQLKIVLGKPALLVGLVGCLIALAIVRDLMAKKHSTILFVINDLISCLVTSQINQALIERQMTEKLDNTYLL